MANKTNHIRTGKMVSCKICDIKIYKKGYLLKKYRKFYCSRKCLGVDNAKGIHKKYKNKERHWLIGKNNHKWKGDDVGYQALHDWIRRKKGTPKKCELCKTIESTKYEWANTNHEYKRNIDDWIRLCTKCHSKYDNKSENMKKIRKEKFWNAKKK